MSAVLLDPNSLAQFALIAAAGLWLLALVVPIHPLALIAVPVAGLATAFVFLDSSSTANAYFFDDWFATGATLWPVPYSERLAIFLGSVFSLGLIVTSLYAAIRLSRPSRLSWAVAGAAGSCVCVVLVVWSSQPAIWQSALRAAPAANLPDFDLFIATKYATVAELGPGVVRVSYPEALITASRESDVKPSSRLQLSTGNLFFRETAGKVLASQSWPNRAVTIPQWATFRSSIQSIWIEVLVGSPSWSATSPPVLSSIALQVNGVSVPAFSASIVAQGWARVDFQSPSELVSASGRLELLPTPSSLLWSGGTAGPWLRVLPAAGTVHAVVDSEPIDLTYQLSQQGQGYVLGLPLKSTFAVTLDSLALPASNVQGAVLHWPNTPEVWKQNRWFQSLGAAFGLALFGATGWALTYYLRRIYPMHTNFRNKAPDSDIRIDATAELIGPFESHPKC
jgi:hypothetical protein